MRCEVSIDQLNHLQSCNQQVVSHSIYLHTARPHVAGKRGCVTVALSTCSHAAQLGQSVITAHVDFAQPRRRLWSCDLDDKSV